MRAARQSHQLSNLEQRQFYNLRPFPGDAWNFWRRIAEVRGLDPESLITNSEIFSALPLGHGKHWCFPISLRCKKRPGEASAERGDRTDADEQKAVR